VRRAREGDAAAYGELARRHRRAALRVATVVLGAADGADDVVQQAMVQAWRALDRFDVGRAFRPWLLRIVANLARNDRRSRGRRARLAVRAAGRADGSGAATPEEVVVGDAERRMVVNAMSRLAAPDRLVIALRHFEQLSEAEMADVLDCPAGTVKSRLSRAMARLRTELARQDREEVAHG
jgi:RNA polymerase sigma factor (sigma-70 family)